MSPQCVKHWIAARLSQPRRWSVRLETATARAARSTTRPKLAFLAHARLRRTSPMSLYAAAAAMEALRGASYIPKAGHRLGIIFCVTAGCVQYSRRFYDEAWRNPPTASPLVFPETVFNAPSSI